jgi:hypothetical protein
VQVSVGAGPVRWYGLGALLWWLGLCGLRLMGRGLWWLALHPRTTAAITVSSLLLWGAVAHPITTGLLVAAVTETADAAWLCGRRSRLLAWWRSPWVYRRRWRAAMLVAELDRVDDVTGVRELPRLGRVRCLEGVDVVQVRGLLGQRFSQWEDAGPMLAHAFKATSVDVRRGDDRRLTLVLGRGQVGRRWDREKVDYEEGDDFPSRCPRAICRTLDAASECPARSKCCAARSRIFALCCASHATFSGSAARKRTSFRVRAWGLSRGSRSVARRLGRAGGMWRGAVMGYLCPGGRPATLRSSGLGGRLAAGRR